MAEDNKPNFRDEELKAYNNYMETIKRYLTEQSDMAIVAEDAINYILRQLNTASLNGVLNQKQHSEVLSTATDGLFTVIYFSAYTDSEHFDFTKRDELFYSSFNLIVLMLSLAFDGRKYILEKMKIEASANKQITVKY
jgi:hypothetical protein